MRPGAATPSHQRTGRASGRSARTAIGLGALALAGCGPRNYVNENDALRRQVLDLQRQVQAEKAAASEALAKLSEAERVREQSLPKDVLEAIPRCAEITIENNTGLVRSTPDAPAPDAIDVYIRPLDGRRRFVQIVGRLAIEVTLLPTPGPDAPPPRRLAYTELTPTEVREAYRVGLFAAHYTVRLPLPGLPSPIDGELVVRVQFFDALTGVVHDASYTLRPASGG